VSWDEAYAYLAEKLTGIAARHGWRANSWITMSGNYGIKAGTVAERVTNCLGGTLFTRAGLSSDGANYSAICRSWAICSPPTTFPR
jgi:hypothetical protein